MSRYFAVFLLLNLSLALSACGGELSLNGQPTPTVSGAELYRESFDKAPENWGIWNEDVAKVGWWDSGWRMLVNQTQYDFWSVAGKDYVDVMISVDARKLAGPDDNDLGIICRYQNDKNFYMFLISSDGYYGIGKMKDGQHYLMGMTSMSHSDVVNTGDGLNQIEALCYQDRLALVVNGQKLTETTDSDFYSGDVGVIAGAYDEAGVDVFFDNFVVRQP